jgi:hypothetical protein
MYFEERQEQQKSYPIALTDRGNIEIDLIINVENIVRQDDILKNSERRLLQADC